MDINISGRVVRGTGYGRKLGFPTANLDRRQFVRIRKKVKLGIYAGSVVINSKRYKAGIVIGPIDGTGLPKLEAHIIGWSGSLYRKKITLRLISYLRPFRSYRSVATLKQAIAKDIKQIKKLNF